MNTPTFIDAPIDTQALAVAHLAPGAAGTAHCAKRSDVMFVLSSLAVGGSERKIARMANRLKEDGRAGDARLPQRTVHARVDGAA